MLNSTTYRTASITNCASVSHAQAVARKLISVAVQTDLSFTPDSIVTITATNSTVANSPSTSAHTEDCGAFRGYAKNQSKSNIPHYRPVANKKQGNPKVEPTSSKLIGKRPAKGSDDSIRTYTSFGSLEDIKSESTASPKPIVPWKRGRCLTWDGT